MNWKMVDLHICGIKCDACDFAEPNVDVKDYISWLNVSCPSCGANLLTEADHKTTKRVLFWTFWFNVLMFPIHLLTLPFQSKKERTIIPFTMDGSGKVKLK